MDLKLIEAVKKFPCLWNTSLLSYKCSGTRDAAWEKIVKMNKFRSIKSAKVRWKQLRDCHRDALKRQKLKRSGHAGAKIREWKYQRNMEFLLPNMSSRDKESVHKEKSTTPQIIEDESSSSSEHSSNQEDDNLIQDDIANKSCKGKVTSSLPAKKKKGDTEDEENYRKKMQDLKKLLKPPDYDEVDLFFLSMAKTVKKLPAYLQVSVKRKCFSFISEAEESQTMSCYNQNTGCTPNAGVKENHLTIKLETELLPEDSTPPSPDADQT